VIEIEALRLSMRNGGDEWEAEIVAALHRLQKFIGRSAAPFREAQDEYDRVPPPLPHRSDWRVRIAAAAGAPPHLYDQTFRYRAIVMAHEATPRKTKDIHAPWPRWCSAAISNVRAGPLPSIWRRRFWPLTQTGKAPSLSVG